MNTALALLLGEVGLAFPEDLPQPIGKRHAGVIGEYRCLSCGCTDSVACEGGCYWVTPGLCSECAAEEVRHADD